MKAQLHQFTQSQFVRNVAIVATGTAGAQAITMAFAPLITRLYGPEAFGLLGVFTALLMILAPVAAFTYPIAIVLPKEEQEAIGLAKISFYIATFTSSLVSVVIILWGEQAFNLLGAEEIYPFAFFIPLAMLFMAIFQIGEQLAIRYQLFKVTAKIAIYKSFVVGSLQTGLGLLKPMASILIAVSTVGHLVQATLLLYSINKHNKLKKQAHSSVNINLKKLAYKHRDFAIYRTPQVFINAISLSLPVLMLASFFGPATAGFYSIAMSVLGMPVLLIGKSVGDVFYQRITEATHNQENPTKLLTKATLGLAAFGTIPFGIIMLWGPWLFSFVFGNDWERAGEYAQWLALWLLVSLVARPAIAAIPALNLQAFFLIHELISVVLRILALVIGFKIFTNDYETVMLFSLANVVIYLFLILFVLRKSMDLKKTLED